MNLDPERDWVIAKAMLLANPGRIVDPNAQGGISRFYLIESVGPEAIQKGFAVGDIVLCHKVYDMKLNREIQRVTFPVAEVIIRARHATLAEFTDLKGNPLVSPEQAA